MLETALTFPRYKETNVGRAIPAPILTRLLDSDTLTRRWLPRGRFFRFAYLSGVRRGQLLATRLAQFQAETGSGCGRLRFRRRIWLTECATIV